MSTLKYRFYLFKIAAVIKVCSEKETVMKILENLMEAPIMESFFIKLQTFNLLFDQKEIRTRCFACSFPKLLE